MSGEILTVQVGQCGICIGNQFWDLIRSEHKLSLTGKLPKTKNTQSTDKLDVYFNETEKNQYSPRSIFVDMDPSMTDIIKESRLSTFYNPNNNIFGASSTYNNWARGHYTEGSELIDEIVCNIRKEIEECDSPQGINMMHSLGGGTGSGLGTLILLKIRDNYPTKITSTFTIYNSYEISNINVEPYNMTLGMHQLIENSDITFVIDNVKLFNVAKKQLKIDKPKYSNINWIIGLLMMDVTRNLRYKCELYK